MKIRKCIRCGDPSHKVVDYTFEENKKRVDNILIRNESG